ncbi:MAG: helix-turn-helix transcriptional regulator [Halieaceae bacterium]|jgi:DNA-binding CsgD family transcriptional regulator|nr:helix-turn-helix transcriptional regulator [Halieaceae bacterium]
MLQTIEGLKLRVFDVVAQPSALSEVLDDVASGTGANAAGVADVDLSLPRLRAFVGSRLVRGLYDRQDEEPEFQSERPLYPLLATQVGRGRFASDDELLVRFSERAAPPAGISDFRSLLRDRYGVHYRVQAPLHRQEQQCVCASLLFGAGSPVAWGEATERGNQILPHLAKALAVARPFAALEERFRSVLDVLDRLALAVLISGLDGSVWLTNAAGRAILERRDALRIDRHGKLAATNAEAESTLANAFDGVRALGPGDRMAQRLCLRRAAAGGAHDPYVADCSVLRHSDFGGGERGLGVLLLLSDPDSAAHLELGPLQQAFDMTRSERAVCEMVIGGLSNAEIADQRNVSPDTVASQVKAVFRKTGCKRRSDLVHLAYRMNAPVRS